MGCENKRLTRKELPGEDQKTMFAYKAANAQLARVADPFDGKAVHKDQGGPYSGARFSLAACIYELVYRDTENYCS